MGEYFRYFPTFGGDYIDLGNQSGYILRNFAGTGSTQTGPQTQKAPYQIGQTYLNTEVSNRVITMTVRIAANDLTEANRLKQDLASKMVAEPEVGTEPASLGLLQYYREGQKTLQIDAVPRNSPQFTQVSRRGNVYDADLEFYCPYPYFEETSSSSRTFGSSGGITFSTTFPLEVETYDITTDIENQGDVAVPFLLKVFGELTTFRIINNTTDKILEVTGTIASGERIEVDTTFGQKSVVLVASDGTRTDVFERVSLDKRDFFKLERGINSISFETDTNVDGYANLQWRENFAGL